MAKDGKKDNKKDSSQQEAVQRAASWKDSINKGAKEDNRVSAKNINKAVQRGANQEQINSFLKKKDYGVNKNAKAAGYGKSSGSFAGDSGGGGGGDQSFGGGGGSGDSFNALSNKAPKNEAWQSVLSGMLINRQDTSDNINDAIRYMRETSNEAMQSSKVQDERRAGYGLEFLATQGTADRDLVGKQGEEQREGIRTTGGEERETLRERTRQDLLLRADARGQIERQGKKFFA